MANRKVFVVMLGIMLTFGLVLAGCGDGAGGSDNGGGDQRDKLVGTWVKDGGAVREKFEHSEHGQTYFRYASTGAALITGDLSSYDGTTAKITGYDSAKTVTEFKAAVSGNKLTISGIPEQENNPLFGKPEFNGTYTKQP